jgi:hypothetical protein
MKKPPLRLVKDSFESKEKLVEAVRKLATEDLWLDRVSSAKGLGRVANGKLVRLHTILSDAKKRFGSREKLITAILELEKRAKDSGYRARLEQFPLPRLMDVHASAGKRIEKAVAKTKPKVKHAPKPAPVKKVAKKAPVKKAHSKRPPKR